MNNTLLDCKAKAQTLTNSQNPPRKENGRKKGYMAIMKELWDNCGYAELNIPEKNLRNQAGKLEKDIGSVQSTILRNAGERTGEIDQEINGLELNNSNFEQGNENTTNLHTRELQSPEGDEPLLTNEVTTLLEGAAPRFTLISQTIGDFTMREVDTRVKQRPTQADINNINLAVNEIVNREQQQHSINPNRNPFEYLWMINCILYAVVVAFLFYKKWKKPAGAKGQKERKTQSQKLKDAYISRATELRRKISIAKAELELEVTKTAMEDIGLIWNEKKCSIAHIKKGVLDSTNHNDRQSITNLKDGETYRFLGILENTQQEDSKVLETTSKTYQQRLSVIWSSPLSDFHKVTATNQYALPALSYPMWTQTWQINALKQIDRESRKIIKDNGGSHPATSTDLYYLPRKMGGRGLKSVETQYKMTKVKTAVKLYTNQDSTMELGTRKPRKCSTCNCWM